MDSFYQLLERIGYVHPIHPPVTHLPVGLVIGAFLLGLASYIFRSQSAGRASRYCMLIAVVSLVPTALFGYMDWQRFYAGGWLMPVKVKMVLASILLILTVASLVAGRWNDKTSVPLTGMYTLALFVVLGLGWFGGELAFSGRVPAAPPEFAVGQKLFRANCSGCHPYGTNIVAAHAELRGSDEYRDDQTFLRWIRDPRMDNGARGVMPPFAPSRSSDAQANELRKYIVEVMGPPKPASECNVVIPAIAVNTDPAHVAKGKALFDANCTSCHSLSGAGEGRGPDLKGILKRSTLPIGDLPATPESIFKQLRCPYKEMPSFRDRLKDEEVLDLIAFLNTQ